MDETRRDEILEAYGRHARARGAGDWAPLADLFTEDGRYFDPIFGWHQGRESIRRFLERAGEGLALRTFSDLWHVADDERLVIYWQCTTPGQAADELYHGFSALRYAGGGLWSEQMDLYDREQALGSRAGAQRQ